MTCVGLIALRHARFQRQKAYEEKRLASIPQKSAQWYQRHSEIRAYTAMFAAESQATVCLDHRAADVASLFMPLQLGPEEKAALNPHTHSEENFILLSSMMRLRRHCLKCKAFTSLVLPILLRLANNCKL